MTTAPASTQYIMPKSLNSVDLIGHLGKDPEVRSTSSGTMVATFSLATNESYKPAGSDEYQEKTEWHNIVAWGRLAEIAGEYLSKGKQCYIRGRLQTRSWDDQNGVKRYTTEIVANDLILLGGGESKGGGRPPHSAESDAPVYTGKQTASQAVAKDISAASVASQFDGTAQPPEEIPF